MKTNIDLIELDKWKREVEKEVDRIVRKRFPNCRTFAYLMLVTDSGPGGYIATCTLGDFWRIDEEEISKAAKIQTDSLERQTLGDKPKRGRKKGEKP